SLCPATPCRHGAHALLRLSGLRAFTASKARIGGKIRPKNLLDLAAKRSPFHVHPGSHWWMCAHAGRRTEDQTWHSAKRVTPPNTTSQRRRKWRRKSANSCAATS